MFQTCLDTEGIFATVLDEWHGKQVNNKKTLWKQQRKKSGTPIVGLSDYCGKRSLDFFRG